MRFISHHEIERRLTGDRVEAVVVCEFSVGDLISPGTRVGLTEDSKVHFNLLVDTFCFTVGLRVVGGGEREVVIEKLSELLGKG